MSRLDRLLVALVGLALLGLTVVLWRPAQQGAWAEVLVGGEVVRRLALDHAQRIEIGGRLGASVLEVAQGRARFVDSPCPGKLCVHAGWLRHTGESSFCLPNGVGLRITGLHEVYDAINF